jgi:hypothetical protein
MIAKHRGDKVSQASNPWEPSMSFSEQLRYLRSPSTLRAAGRRTQYARYRQIDAKHVVPLRSLQQDPSQQSRPTRLSRSAGQAFVRFASKVLMLVSDILFALLCWITAQFLAGCADYAMSFGPVSADTPADVARPDEPAFALMTDVKASECPEAKI